MSSPAKTNIFSSHNPANCTSLRRQRKAKRTQRLLRESRFSLRGSLELGRRWREHFGRCNSVQLLIRLGKEAAAFFGGNHEFDLL